MDSNSERFFAALVTFTLDTQLYAQDSLNFTLICCQRQSGLPFGFLRRLLAKINIFYVIFLKYGHQSDIRFNFLVFLFVSAAKTALSTFLFSKDASQREKDLIKSLKVWCAGSRNVTKKYPLLSACQVGALYQYPSHQPFADGCHFNQ